MTRNSILGYYPYTLFRTLPVVFVYLSVALTTGERQQKSACLSKGGDMQSIPEELGALSLEGGLDGRLYIPDESSKPL